MFAIDPEGVETRVIHELIDFGGKDVLEVGAGDGRLTGRYAARAASVLALEAKELLVEQAREATPPGLRRLVSFRVADATRCDLPAAAFDVALFSRSL
jgi:ubiquinone/menaquinone biosynthesis C-methylase UbiE